MCFTEECLEVWKYIDSPQTGQNWLKFGVEIPFDSMSESFEFPNRHFNIKEATFVTRAYS